MLWRLAYFLPHLLSLCVSIGWYLYFGDNPRVFLYAYIISYAAELLTLALFMRLYKAAPGTRRLLELLTRAPARTEVSAPVIVEGKGPAGLGSIFMVLGVITFFGFIMANVNSDKELDVTPFILGAELLTALPLCLIYWLETICSRSITVNFSAAPETNYGYNSANLTYLTLAVLGSGALMVCIQDNLTKSTGWAVVGPLLFFRHGIFILLGLLGKDRDTVLRGSC